MAKLWAYCVTVRFKSDSTIFTNCGLISADSKYEAEGKALVIAKKAYPSESGWQILSTSVSDQEVYPERVLPYNSPLGIK